MSKAKESKRLRPVLSPEARELGLFRTTMYLGIQSTNPALLYNGVKHGQRLMCRMRTKLMLLTRLRGPDR